MELTFELAEKVLAAQPFSVLLGARLTAFGAGGATLQLDIRKDLQQQNGYLHGGVLGYAADNAITFAAGTALGPEVLTGGFTISYLRPLSVVDDAGATTLCAIAQGTVIALRR